MNSFIEIALLMDCFMPVLDRLNSAPAGADALAQSGVRSVVISWPLGKDVVTWRRDVALGEGGISSKLVPVLLS